MRFNWPNTFQKVKTQPIQTKRVDDLFFFFLSEIFCGLFFLSREKRITVILVAGAIKRKADSVSFIFYFIYLFTFKTT